MSQLLGMSFDGLSSPAITLGQATRRDRVMPTGWGFGWYPGGDYAAALIKDPVAAGETPMTALLRDWDRFRGTLFLCHLRGAAKRVSQEDTHPFSRSMGGRDWMLAHNGDLDPLKLAERPLSGVFLPVGHTDSERALCLLVQLAEQNGARCLADLGWEKLHAFFRDLDSLGTANFIVTDGDDLVAYRDQESYQSLYAVRRCPPHGAHVLANRYLELSLSDPLDSNRTGVLVATTPLSDDGWAELPAGGMIVARRGTLTWTSLPFTLDKRAARTPSNPPMMSPNFGAVAPSGDARLQPSGQMVSSAFNTMPAPMASHTRILRVAHETTYTYDEPVERSTHVFRFRPVHDPSQNVLEHSLEITPAGVARTFEDVFGNVTTRVRIEQPYTMLKIVSRSRVEVASAVSLGSPRKRATIPLVWMPWQRQMMVPYLLPPELPETQLRELSEFAMSFAARQDYDLDETLRDLNDTIYRDFTYIPGSTTIETTPWEVYSERRGVCQDFANLFICLARLLNIPARYRVGYIFTGSDYANTEQGDASHAWVEAYLPQVGWRGYDPTNGRIAGFDHIRVAVGRNYRDATPTSGTIFKGGGTERLEVSVRVNVDE